MALDESVSQSLTAVLGRAADCTAERIDFLQQDRRHLRIDFLAVLRCYLLTIPVQTGTTGCRVVYEVGRQCLLQAPGGELEDWLAAEREVDEVIND
jgi:hypothetical protein